jgi:hypothetical protein
MPAPTMHTPALVSSANAGNWGDGQSSPCHTEIVSLSPRRISVHLILKTYPTGLRHIERYKHLREGAQRQAEVAQGDIEVARKQKQIDHDTGQPDAPVASRTVTL